MAQIGVDKGEYVFDASAKTITFTGVTVDTVDQIKLVNNVKDGIILFNPIDPTKLGVLTGSVLALTHDTTAMADTDDLFICINLGIGSNVISQDETGNSTKVLLGASATFTGSWESVIDYTTVAVTLLGDNVTDGTLYIESSQDGGTTVNSVPYPITDATFQLPKIWNVVESDIRIRYVNGTTAQTGFFQLQTKYSNGQELGLLQAAGDTINVNTAVQITKAISTGIKPDGTYRNAVENGVAVKTDALLGIGLTFTSGWIDTHGYNVIEAFIKTDVESAVDGLCFEFTDNLLTPTAQESEEFTFSSEDVTRGYKNVFIQPKLVGFRVKYTNGATGQSSFLLQTDLKTNGSLSVRLNDTLTGKEDSTLTRSVITGVDNTGTFGNVRITPTREMAMALFDSQTGARQIVDLNGAAKVGEAFILIGSAFYGQPLNPLQWDTDFTGSGGEAPLPGTHRLNTGITANSRACLQTVRKARFMIAQFNIAHFGIQLNTANLLDVNCIRRFGVFDPISLTENGLFFEVTSLDGIVPQWYVVSIKDGVETQRTAQADFNGASASLFNPTAPVSAYEIQYNAGTAFFFQGSNFIHQVRGVPVYSGTYNFKVGFDVENTNGNTADNILDFRAGGVYRLGEPKGDPVSRAFIVDTVVVNGTGSISSASLSRTGNSGGNGTMKLYDGVDNTGFYMARVDIGGDDVRSISINSTFTDGLFVEITGTGTNTATLSFE